MVRLKILNKEFIFQPFVEGSSICHASNICAIKNGDLLAAWFAGSKEGADDVSIWISRRDQAGWSSPVCCSDQFDEPCWNPVLHQLPDGRIMLFFKVGREISRWRTYTKVSTDLGYSWSVAQELVSGDEGGRGPVRCKVIGLSDGRLIAGNSSEQGIWRAFADYSVDGGVNWNLSNPITIDVNYDGENIAADSTIEVSAQSFFGRGVIQPTLWESGAGHVHMMLRSSEGLIYRADSSDYGCSWSSAYATKLPNNNSGIDVANIDDRLLVLCSNPVAEAWGARTPLTLQVSEDNGLSWCEVMVLESQPGEYSYPSLISTGSKLHLTYTFDRKTIAYCEIMIVE